MAIPQATNTYVYIIRDEIQKNISERIIPGRGRVKPHKGLIFSIGSKVTDKDIKDGFKSKKSGLFHSGIGQEIEIDGVVYLCLEEAHIIGVI